MCKLYHKISEKQFTGYKVAVKKRNGKLYSPIMGIEYKVGPVEIPKKQKLLIKIWNDDLLEKYACNHNWKMTGRTGVFVKRLDALEMLSYLKGYQHGLRYLSHKLVLVKITLSGDLMNGYFMGDLVAGKHIDKIGECAN